MADNLTIINSGEVAPQYEKAIRLHQRIVISRQTAADAIVEYYRNLKEMRDTKLYLQLGYEDFNNYVETELGFGWRQAYDYISTYEKLGRSFLQSTASLGISKLKWLATVPALDREDFVQEHD